MRIVVVGGGYAGIKALRTLAQERVDAEVILVDQHPYHYLQTESYDLVASKSSVDDTFIYLPTLVAGIHRRFRFVCDRAESVENDVLVCRTQRIRFDYLLIASGSVTRFLEGFENKGEYSLGVKSLRASLKIKHFFENELFRRLESQERNRTFTIAVIGGGLSGVEIAAEMKHYFNRFARHHAPTCGTIHIKLVSKHLLKHLKTSARKKAIERLARLGVETVPAYVVRVEGNRAQLDDGSTLTFDFAVFAGGIAPSPFVRNLPFPKNKNGFLLPNASLGLSERIFVAGDCAELRDKHGNIVPPTAQSAEQSGIIAARNIAAAIDGRPMKHADIRLRGMAIALGGRYALSILPGGLSVGGAIGYAVKKTIELSYKLPLRYIAKETDVCER